MRVVERYINVTNLDGRTPKGRRVVVVQESLPNNQLSTSRSFKRIIHTTFSRRLLHQSVNIENRVLRISNGFTVVNMEGFQRRPSTMIEVSKVITIL